MPRFKLVKVGAWEGGRFIGCVIFGQGATPEIAKPFGLERTQVCELVRVALDRHKTPTTKIVAQAIKFLRRRCPGLELVVSFADSAQGHIGTIYQAGNWFFVGSYTHHAYRVLGKVEHPKTLHSRYGKGGQSISWLKTNVDPQAERIETPPKHKYVMPLTKNWRKRLAEMSKPYPKREEAVLDAG